MLFELAWTDTFAKHKCRCIHSLEIPRGSFSPPRFLYPITVLVKPSVRNPTPPSSLYYVLLRLRVPLKRVVQTDRRQARRRRRRVWGSKEVTRADHRRSRCFSGVEMGLEPRNSKTETRNAPSRDPPPSKETYGLRVETDGRHTRRDEWKGGRKRGYTGV